MNKEKIYEILKDKFKLDEINDDMKFKDFGVDSISLIEMVMDLEDEFNIEMEDDVIANFSTVGDVVNYFENRK